MNKLTAWLLTFLMAISVVGQQTYAQDNLQQLSTVSSESNILGNLETVLRLDYPVIHNNVEKTNIKIALLKDENEIVSIPIKNLISWNEKFVLDEKEYSVDIVACDRDGIELGKVSGDIEYVYSYKINFKLIPVGSYKVKLSGDGYKQYISEDIDISSYSQRIVVGTTDATFTAGDINKDKSIDKNDLEEMKNLLDAQAKSTQGTSIETGDINKDGIIDITDLAFIYNNFNANGEALINSTSKIIDNKTINTDELLKGTVALEPEDISILFGQAEDNKKVSLKRKDGEVISQTNALELPIEFNDSVEMQQIKITAFSENNAPKKGTATIEYTDDNGNPQLESFEFDTGITDEVKLITIEDRPTLVINLGKRVAVKKVIIKITETTTANSTLADVAKVEFLKDIISDNNKPSVGAITNLKAISLDKAVELSWNRLLNMTGYKVYYGLESGNYIQTITTEENSIRISDLENMQVYYFAVSPINGEWEGSLSNEISATPETASKPEAPKGLNVEAGNQMLKVSWSKSKNATGYSVYYQKSGDTDYIKAADNIETTSYTITELTNDVEYYIYVTASNKLGESGKSDIQVGVPKNIAIEAPQVPTKNRIGKEHITDVKLSYKPNYVVNDYPDGYNPWCVVDDDYSTYWTARAWWEDPSHIITFDQAYDMDYVVYVPRLDGNFKNSINHYTITVWGEDDPLDGKGTTYYTSEDRKVHTGNAKENGYVVLTFPKTKVKQIKVGMFIWNGAPTNSSASEILFYEYYSIDDDIKALFADNTFAQISQTATQQEIERLRNILNEQTDTYFVDKAILLEELDMAEALLNNDQSKIGKIVNVEQGRNANENHGFSMGLNDFQPLGIAAKAWDKLVIYVSNTNGETPTLVATQYYPDWNNWKKEIALQEGRNVIEIPKIGSDANVQRGGSLYLTYHGTNPDIKIHVKGGTVIPTLSLNDYFDNMDSNQLKQTISQYITDLTAHVASIKGNKQNSCINVTEVSNPDVLLSIPASQVLSKIQSSGSDINTQIEFVEKALKAWEKQIEIEYSAHGLSHDIAEGVDSWPSARQNIRYTRMFEGAFMYASSGHIGIEWGSTPGMIGSSFGWGISHEIGHVIDQSGLAYAEVTNNIYSLFVQTYDNGSTIGKSRLEQSNKYEDIYNKVSTSSVGKANNVFTQLGMYWQLHLAYDDVSNNFDFYSQLYRKCRAGGYPAGLDKDNLFVILASETAQKDLRPYFKRWGVIISDEANAYLDTKGFAVEDRAIYYIDDEARRYRLNGGTGISSDTAVTASVYAQDNRVSITINDTANKNDILGYEIIRNDKPIAFTSESEYVDIIGTANNVAFSYSVKAYDKLLNPPRQIVAEPQIKIGYDVVVTPQTISLDNNTINIDFGSEQQVAGMKFIVPNTSNKSVSKVVYNKAILLDKGYFIVEISTDNVNWTKVKDSNFNSASGEYRTYFNKLDASDTDTSIGIYNARYLRITGQEDEIVSIKDSVEILAYPGDNIEISTESIGYLKQDFVYSTLDGDEVIPAGTLIVTGSYRGDPIYNVISLKGMYSTNNALETSVDTQEERFIEGYGLMFATVPEDGNVAEISDGFWLFVPEVQKETEVNDRPENGNTISVLPNQIKAQLYRSVDATDLTNSFLVSDTVWVTSPAEYAMPYIVLEGEQQ